MSAQPQPPDDPTSILDLDDLYFQAAWIVLDDDEKAALPRSVRTECIDRFRKLTDYVTKVSRLPVESPTLNGHDTAPDLNGDPAGDWTLDGPEDAPEPPRSRDRPLTAAEAHQPYREAQNPDPEPVDLTKSVYHGIPLPLAYVPACLKPLLSDFQARTGIAHGPAFLGFLAGLATFANDFIRLQPKQLDHTWTVRPVVWVFAIGGSSSGKTPALETGMEIVRRKDTAAVVENTRKRKDYEHLLDQYADECAVARKGKLPRPEEPPPPLLREFWIQRGTVEGIVRTLEYSPKVIQYMNEGSGIISGMDRYAPGGKGSGDREFYLQLWDGGPGKNTLAGKTVTLNNASAVICGGSTPGAMRNSCAGKLQNDGFLQRTLLCMVPDQIKGADTVPDAAALAMYERVIDGLLDMATPATLLLSPDAQQVYNEFCDQLRELIAHEENESLSAHIGKWYGLAPRLMLLYHLAECASHGQLVGDGQRVSVDIARQVCALLMEWQLSHLRQFWHELMSEKTGRKFAQIIARYILAHPELSKINFRNHISNPHWTQFDKLKPWEIKEACNTLTSAGWWTPEEGRTNSYGVASNYRVNPKLAGMFEDEREDELARRAADVLEIRERRAASRERTAARDDD